MGVLKKGCLWILWGLIGISVFLLVLGFLLDDDDGSPPSEPSVSYVTPTVDELNVRKGPGSSYEKASPVPISEGDKVIAVKDSAGWTRIKLSENLDFEMWAASRYLQPYEVYQAAVEARQDSLESMYGKKPDQWRDGSYTAVENYLERIARNPESITIEGCTGVYTTVDGWLVGCDYRGENGFGGIVRQSNWFTIRSNVVREMHDAEEYSVE